LVVGAFSRFHVFLHNLITTLPFISELIKPCFKGICVFSSFLIFTLGSFVSLYFFYNCIIQSRIFIFEFFKFGLVFFLAFFVDFRLFSILSFNQDFQFVDFFIDLVLIFLLVFPFNCFVKFIFIFNLALQSKTIHPYFFFFQILSLFFYFLFSCDCFFFQSRPFNI
jgi:hypothetical protein